MTSEAIVFNGDGYSDDWHAEAEKRGLPNLKTTPDALPAIIDEKVFALLGKYNVLSQREVESRYSVYAEQYNMTINVESNLMVEMATTTIYPAAIRYQTELATAYTAVKAAGVEADSSTLSKVTALIRSLQKATADLVAAKEIEKSSQQEECEWCRDGIIPKMEALRAVVDELETIVADDLWPLPTYQEMLSIR